MRLVFAMCLAVGAALLTGSLRETAMSHVIGHSTYEDVYYLPSPITLQAISLGHEDALAAALWMRALIYVGDEFAHHGELDNVFRYADAILHLAPDFRKVYSWACTMGLYRPVAPSQEDAVRAVSYLERAANLFPEDYELQWELGAAYAYDLPSFTADPDEKTRLRLRGNDHMLVAASHGAGPAWLALSNATALVGLGEADRAARHLEQVYAITRDEQTREEIAARLAELRSESAAAALRSAEQNLHQEARDNYPWLPVDFFVLIGPRRSE